MSRPPDKRLASVFFAALAVVVTAVTFSPTRNYGFVNWDDDVYVTDNPLVQAPSVAAIPRIFTQFISGNYHPLTIASYVLDGALFGSGAGPFHLVNLGLHLLNTVLVLRLLTALGTPFAGAAIGALFWAVYPLRVEAVAWISGRKDLLATLFTLGSILVYLGFRKSGRRWAALGSMLLFLLALLAKATAVAVPGLLLAIDWLQGRRITFAVVREKIPYLGLVAVFSMLAVLARHSYQGVLDEQGFGWQYLVFQGTFRGAFYFLLRSLLPLTNPAWLYPDTSFPPLFSGQFAMAIGLLAAVVAGALFSLRRTRKVAFALLFFFVALLPVLPVAVLGYSADRFTYMPAIGIAYLVGELIGRWQASAAAQRLSSRLLSGVALLALALLLARETMARSAAWTNSEALWTTAIREYLARGQEGSNLAHAFTYRARSRHAAGRSGEALEDYAEAVSLNPQSADLRNERGIALASSGAYSEALAEFTAALEREPGRAAAAFNRGLTYLTLGKADEAKADFSRALAAEPSNTPVLIGRARALALQGEWAAALRDAEWALAREPGNRDAMALRDEMLAAGARVP